MNPDAVLRIIAQHLPALFTAQIGSTQALLSAWRIAMTRLTRRALVALLAAGSAARGAHAEASRPRLVVSKDPSCGCCSGWAEHMRAAGFAVEIVNTEELNRIKTRLGVPRHLASCHTAEVDGYVVEGHVPADAVRRLLAERPRVKGLAVPGMPIGSPGMEVDGAPPETYDVIAFGPGGETRFGRYKGATAV